MKEFKELKEGDKLYNLSYHNKSFFGYEMKREMQTVTIKRIRGITALLKGGYAWGVSKNNYGSDWFDNKLDCYKSAKELHENKFEDVKENYDAFKKEIKYLEKKIKQRERE